MGFIAIDFETANNRRDSICSIGLVKVKDRKVVEKIHTYINEYCTVNEPRMRNINPSIAEDRATVCVVESHKHISAINTSGILKKHA